MATATSKLPPDLPPPGAGNAARVAELQSKILADPTYVAIWGDAKRKDDLALLLTGVSQAIADMRSDGTESMNGDLVDALMKKKLVVERDGGTGGAWMWIVAYFNDTARFPRDFVQASNALLAGVTNEPHRGTWVSAKWGAVAKDFSALAYLLHPDDPSYLREFIAARRDGAYRWQGVQDPWRPYLVRERAALERLALLTTLTGDEQARLDTLRVSKWSETYVEWVDLAKLLREYKSNEVRADSEYEGHVVQITGVLGAVRKDVTDSIYATIGTGAQFETPEVQCFFQDMQARRVSALNTGNSVTVTGKVKGLTLLNVIVEDCEIN